jgi:hypothetical protein
MRSLRRNGDPIKESSADPRRAPETAYGGGSINPGSNKMIMDLIARTKAGEFDGQLPSGKVDTADPLFDLLSLGSGQLGVRAIKRGVGEAGEAVAKQAAKGVKPFTKMKSDLDLNKRELNNLIRRYEEAYDEYEDVQKIARGTGFSPDMIGNRFLRERKEALRMAEKEMEDYGVNILDLKKRISELTKESY